MRCSRSPTAQLWYNAHDFNGRYDNEGQTDNNDQQSRREFAMKKLMVVCAAVALAAVASAKEATLTVERGAAREGCLTDWTPLAVTIVGPVGLPWGSWNVKGLQVGIWNDVLSFSGLQIGAINVADRAYGVQIGFINVIAGDDLPFLPVLNWSF